MPRIRAGSIVEHKELTRAQLLDAAFKLFVANGYAGTSLTDVASLAGVGRTTLYEYFPNKEELYLRMIEDLVPPILTEAMARIPEAPVRERIELVYRECFREIVGHPDVAHALFLVGRELPSESRDQMWHSLDPVRDELLRLCELGVDQGIFSGDARLLQQSVADLLVGAADHVLALGDLPQNGQRVLETRLRFLREGLS